MSKQKSITSFFAIKPSEKRKSEVFDEKPKKIARLDSGESSVVPEKKSDVVEEKPEVSNFEMDQKYTKMFKGLEVMDKSWFNAMKPEMDKEYFQKLSKFVSQKRDAETVYPTVENVFRWTSKSLSKIKVVILGQDPYHGPNQAHGLSFSVLRPTPPPPSLKNMFKELIQDENVPSFTRVPNHGDLSSWADQGVLMLNAVLTVTKSKANSHKGQGWEKFTDSGRFSKFTQFFLKENKLGCVVRMVVDSLLPHAECGPNNHRKDAPLFIIEHFSKIHSSNQSSFSKL